MRSSLLGNRKMRDRRGQGLAEFAIVFPLIALLIFGIFDVGRAVYAYNTIANAAREAARIAAVNQVVPVDPNNAACHEDMPVEDPANPDWSIKACAAQSAIALGVQPSNVTVTYSAPPPLHPGDPTLVCTAPTAGNYGGLNVGCIATVTIEYTWMPATPLISTIFSHGITVTSTSQIPIERVFPTQ